MMRCSLFFSTKFLFYLLILSAIPIALIISLEKAPHPGHVYHYHSQGFFRECAKWDNLNRRFLVSYIEGGIGEVKVPNDHDHDEGVILDEITAVGFKDSELKGNASVGITIDHQRNRVLVVVSDIIWKRYNGLAAYDLSSWNLLFLAHLSLPGDEKSFADDVAVDEEGNSYVTDILGSKIWKVSVDGKLMSTIRSPLFTSKKWYNNFLTLNGIVYHPHAYLLVIHSSLGNLYKIEFKNGEEIIKLVRINNGGSLMFGDGLVLLSPTELVVAGSPRLVESLDEWETCSIVGKASGLIHRIPTSVTLKDGKAYLSHMVGLGYPKKKHVIMEAKFSP